MTPQDLDTIACLALLAAFADGHLGPEERERIQSLLGALGVGAPTPHGLAEARDKDLPRLCGHLSSPEARRTAFEACVAVCHADGVVTDGEEAFLRRLWPALGLRVQEAEAIRRDIGQLALIETPDSEEGSRSGEHRGQVEDVPPSDLDRMILRYAMLAGAAELLPQSAATMIILPVQVKLVYDVGRAKGVVLDRSQILELVAALGIGATSQMVETVARRVLGGVARSVGGGAIGRFLGGATESAAGAVMSFSSTYALGHAALTYYAQGRSLGREDLRRLFRRFQDDAKTVYPRVEEEIRDLATTFQAKDLLQQVWGKGAGSRE